MVMISSELTASIKSTLREHLESRDWQYIDGMFEEMYKTKVNGHEIITLKPHPESGDIAMQFYAINGAFYEITSWEYIERIGEKIQ